MKVIFLDIDGVLITHRSIKANRSSRVPDSECVAQLNRIIAATGAMIVISSTWRRIHDLMGPILESWGVVGQVVGVTPVLDVSVDGIYEAVERGTEIAKWLEWHPVDGFVILDDDPDMGVLLPFLVRCDFDDGLTSDLAGQAILRLNRSTPARS